MLFANVRELKLETNKVLDSSRTNGPVVITRRGRPVAIVRSVDSADFTVNARPLWSRLRAGAERAGYKASGVDKLIRQTRRAVK
ncbi:MAG: hypothetical protein CVU77_06535 [Elusimicrobia bacterium HGW-Elusimicrobia-1]|jgi:prevent-host-death family protein|nr:MAG: hypothetical protein CVU77_06535 [Elusimicrobia bacterium HGW-Elusimicrobia-1]